jgi:hypothetical protein
MLQKKLLFILYINLKNPNRTKKEISAILQDFLFYF